MAIVSCIYAIRNVNTGKVYVGKTKNLKNRIATHMSALKYGNHHVEQMQYDHDHFGGEYEILILSRLNDQIPSFMKEERFWFTFFNSTNEEFGYNYKEKHRQFDISKIERWSR